MSRDNELDELIKPIKAAQPNDLQMQKWVRATKSAQTPKSQRFYFQLAAAMVVGVCVGVLAMKLLSTQQSPQFLMAQNSLTDATFEHSHANLD
jgi:F0F1-type ATP synthase assembly protein I